VYINKEMAEARAVKNRAKILRAAQSMFNACTSVSKERCTGCPFAVAWAGCSLNGHPIEWADKLKEAREV